MSRSFQASLIGIVLLLLYISTHRTHGAAVGKGGEASDSADGLHETSGQGAETAASSEGGEDGTSSKSGTGSASVEEADGGTSSEGGESGTSGKGGDEGLSSEGSEDGTSGESSTSGDEGDVGTSSDGADEITSDENEETGIPDEESDGGTTSDDASKGTSADTTETGTSAEGGEGETSTDGGEGGTPDGNGEPGTPDKEDDGGSSSESNDGGSSAKSAESGNFDGGGEGGISSDGSNEGETGDTGGVGDVNSDEITQDGLPGGPPAGGAGVVSEDEDEGEFVVSEGGVPKLHEGEQSKSETPVESETEEKKIEIETNANIKKLIKQFEKENPGVKVPALDMETFQDMSDEEILKALKDGLEEEKKEGGGAGEVGQGGEGQGEGQDEGNDGAGDRAAEEQGGGQAVGQEVGQGEEQGEESEEQGEEGAEGEGEELTGGQGEEGTEDQGEGTEGQGGEGTEGQGEEGTEEQGEESTEGQAEEGTEQQGEGTEGQGEEGTEGQGKEETEEQGEEGTEEQGEEGTEGQGDEGTEGQGEEGTEGTEEQGEEGTEGQGEERTEGQEEGTEGQGEEGTEGQGEGTEGQGDEETEGQGEEGTGQGEGTEGQEEGTDGQGEEGTEGQTEGTEGQGEEGTGQGEGTEGQEDGTDGQGEEGTDGQLEEGTDGQGGQGGEEGTGEEGQRAQRRKRFILRNEKNRWTKGVVPYVISDEIKEKDAHEYKVAMDLMQSETCIRFVPWVDKVTKEKEGLDHKGYLKFIYGGGCWSFIGNLHWGGQTVSCCDREPCVHELGHAMGLSHEQQSPQRTGLIRVNWDNIDKNSWKWYAQKDPDNYLMYNQYDITSNIHYADWAFSTGGRKTWTSLVPELRGASNVYYQFREISLAHDCEKLKCADAGLKCENDGYVTDDGENGECICMCPYGLNRTDSCRTTIKHANTGPWPGKSYAMLAPIDGCPKGFKKGEITHYTNGKSSKTSVFHLLGDYSKNSHNMHFCVMENGAGTGKWPEGSYCIQRGGGKCPEGFEEGYIQFDDTTDKNQNTKSGTLPDGEFGEDTKFFYCCRNDGFLRKPMELPNKDPVVLFKNGKRCQTVKGMFVTEERYGFGATKTFENGGKVPRNLWYWGQDHTYVCYYKPITNHDCGGIITLDREKLSGVIKSPNYPENYDPATECNWLITSPVNTTILLKFEDFEIEAIEGKCSAYLEIRHNLLGQPGIKYCGDSMEESVRSLQNSVGLTFRSQFTGNKKGFKMVASVILPEEHCYDLSDLGDTYRGKVNFTRDMKTCLPWAQTTKCEYYAQNPKYYNKGLDQNYCRNPGDGIRPWCYTGFDDREGCLRNYCDVCLIENLYDTDPSCDKLKVKEGFCSKDPEAFSRCGKTCAGLYPSLPSVEKAIDVTCDHPKIPSDSELVSPKKETYKLGETLKVKCKTSSDEMTVTCLTDGSFNLGNYVCGACPNDWIPHKGHCYKYFHERVQYSDAKKRCDEFGGIVAPVKSADDNEFVVSLRRFLTHIWLGADDLATANKWMWQDGTEIKWLNWQENEPKKSSSNNCGKLLAEDRDSLWAATSCTWTKMPFVCRISVSERKTCVDRRDDCSDMFEANPKSCEVHSEFADYECRHTCGKCPGTSKTCSVTEGFNTVFDGAAPKSLSTGQSVSFACADGHVFSHGSFVRGCTVDGELTGNVPVCLSGDYFPTPLNDIELKQRSGGPWNKIVYVGENKLFTIQKSGEIIQWKFHSKQEGDVALQVWKKIADRSYKLIGQNVYRTATDEVMTFDVPPEDRIQVEPGYLVGIYNGPQYGGITFSYCSKTKYGGQRIRWPPTSSYENFVLNKDYTFQAQTICYYFGVNAMIAAKATANNKVALTSRKEKGPVGIAYTGQSPDLTIHRSGEVTNWRFYSLNAGLVILQVWRHSNADSFEFVGQNILEAVKGYQSVNVSEGERIQVKQGDLIGVYYKNEGGIPFSDCNHPELVTVKTDTSFDEPTSFKAGTTYTFTDAKCRRFSVVAFVARVAP